MNCGICGATDMKTCEACPGGYRDNGLYQLILPRITTERGMKI